MLKVQEYLKANGLGKLISEFGILVCQHPTKPLAILNYDMMAGKKTDPIVRECRGLVLDSRDWSLVARSFPRFFNWGEVLEEAKNFDFSSFIADTKHDGSLVLIYSHDGDTMINTRGSFAGDYMMGPDASGKRVSYGFTWREAISKALGQALDAIKEKAGHLTVVCEFCSPFNKVVRRYERPEAYILTAFDGERELSWDEADALSSKLSLPRPEKYSFNSIDEIQAFLRKQASVDPSFEGVVIRDTKNNRYKCKSSTYLSLHQLANGNFPPKHLVPFALAGDGDELLLHFPDAKMAFDDCVSKVDEARKRLETVWETSKDIPDQKAFALAIKDKTPFTGILFSLRKKGDKSPAALKAAWRESADIIVDRLFG